MGTNKPNCEASRQQSKPLSFYSALAYICQVNTQPSLETCCASGLEWANQKQDCAALPVISDLQLCRIMQEQCCVDKIDYNSCMTGVNLAKQQGVCGTVYSDSTTCEAKTIKRCCNCCHMGKVAQQQGMSCEQNLQFGYQCSLVFRACCVDALENNPSLPGQNDTTGAGQCSQRCLITESGASCSCFEGYKLKPDGRSCEDIDECEIGTHNCAPDFVCQNTQGSFRCRPKTQCGNGFIQDALGNCIDINECVGSSNPCPTGQSCLNTVGSFSCHRNALNCGRGYHLKEDGTRCVDIDECSDSTQPCGEGHICINSPGTYRCECSVGYYFDSISRTCLDVNECDTNPCSQECANVYGSYQCYCRRGYQLSDVDGITCEDIDECALPNGGHICTYRCINVPGSFQCTCPPTGYTLASGGRSCQGALLPVRFARQPPCGPYTLVNSRICSLQRIVLCFWINTNINSVFDTYNQYTILNINMKIRLSKLLSLKIRHIRCERLPCGLNMECHGLPLRITHYYLTFPISIPVPTNIFRMGPVNTVPVEDVHFTITGGNDDAIFSVHKVNSDGFVAVEKPLLHPKDFTLTVEMKLFRHGTITTFLAKIFVFATAELTNVDF
ncbi:FBLN1 protein, partial [Polypterus senegalus]